MVTRENEILELPKSISSIFDTLGFAWEEGAVNLFLLQVVSERGRERDL